MERFARVDVAKAGDHALVEQRELERHLLASTGARQRRGVELRGSGSGPIALSAG